MIAREPDFLFDDCSCDVTEIQPPDNRRRSHYHVVTDLECGLHGIHTGRAIVIDEKAVEALAEDMVDYEQFYDVAETRVEALDLLNRIYADQNPTTEENKQ